MNWNPFKKAKASGKPSALKRVIQALAARQMVAQYDSLQRRGEVLRTQPLIRTDFTETEQVFSAERRILAYAQADQLYDNCSIGATVDTAIRLTIGTTGGTPLFSDERKEAEKAYFTRWAKHCGYAEGECLQDMLALILRMVKVHGDCLVLCDSVTDYKIRVWDADQIVNITDFDLWRRENGYGDDVRQVEGVVVEASGRVLGYFVTMRRNLLAVSKGEATFLPFGLCKRVAYHKKHTQYRGESSILGNQEVTEDTKELLKSEIGAAKLASELSLIVERPQGVDKNALASVIEGFGSDTSELTQGSGDVTDEDVKRLMEQSRDVKTFDAFQGHSAIAEVDAGTHVTNLNNAARPSTAIQQWVDLLDDRNGKALGMMSCLSRGRADKSYSSGQIEVEISWQAFKADQKLLGEVVDYCIERLLPDAEYTLVFPEAFSIDPEKDERVKDMRLRGGRMTYREMLGADYENILRQLSYEKHLLEELDLTNLSFFQSSSGAPIVEATPIEPTEIPLDEQKQTNNGKEE